MDDLFGNEPITIESIIPVVKEHERRINKLEAKLDKILTLEWVTVAGIVVAVITNHVKF